MKNTVCITNITDLINELQKIKDKNPYILLGTKNHHNDKIDLESGMEITTGNIFAYNTNNEYLVIN